MTDLQSNHQTTQTHFTDALAALHRLLEDHGGQTGVAGVIIVTSTPDDPAGDRPAAGFAAQETPLPQHTLEQLLTALSDTLPWPAQDRVAGLAALVRFQFELTPRVVNDRPALTCTPDSLRRLVAALTDLRGRASTEPGKAGRA